MAASKHSLQNLPSTRRTDTCANQEHRNIFISRHKVIRKFKVLRTRSKVNQWMTQFPRSAIVSARLDNRSFVRSFVCLPACLLSNSLARDHDSKIPKIESLPLKLLKLEAVSSECFHFAHRVQREIEGELAK